MTRTTPEYSLHVHELRARARALNEQGSNIGDHRPDVYRDNGVWVYRASALGSCPRALWLARSGVDRSPTNAIMSKAYMEGTNSEPVAIAMATEKWHWKITDPQYEYEIEVMPGVVIRGHLDGLGEDTAMKQVGNVEVKMLGPDLWKMSQERRFATIPHWATQVHLGMRGSGRRLTWMIWGRKDDDGVCSDVTYGVVEYSARAVALAMKRVRDTEAAIASGAHVPCEDEDWGCPYWTLHEGTKKELEHVQDQKIATLARIEYQANLAKKAATEAHDKAKIDLLAAVNERKLGDEVIVEGRGTGAYKLLRVRQTRREIDRGRLREDGLFDTYTYEKAVEYLKCDADTGEETT